VWNDGRLQGLAVWVSSRYDVRPVAREQLLSASQEPLGWGLAKGLGNLCFQTVFPGQGDDQALTRKLPDVANIFLKCMRQRTVGEESGQGEKDVDVRKGTKGL
jgi:hypothetical protein